MNQAGLIENPRPTSLLWYQCPERLEAVLRDQLDAEPDPETVAFANALRAGSAGQ